MAVEAEHDLDTKVVMPHDAQISDLSKSEKRSQLRSRKRGAHLALGLTGVVLVVSYALPGSGLGLEVLRSSAEAAVVGGLADWFAVTALFRRPLGLPIPHTAIIPRKKDELGVGLGKFVEQKFLTAESMLGHLRESNRALQLAEMLSHPKAKELLVPMIIDALNRLMDTISDEATTEFMAVIGREAASGSNLAAVLPGVAAAIVESHSHMDAADGVLKSLDRLLRENPEGVKKLLNVSLGRYSPSFANDYLFGQIVSGLETGITKALTHGTEDRAQLDAWIRGLAASLSDEGAAMAVGERVRQVLSSSGTLNVFQSGSAELRAEIRRDIARGDSKIGTFASRLVVSIGKRLQADTQMQAALNGVFEDILLNLLLPMRSEISSLIAAKIREWPADKVVDLIELEIGKDIQYIRISGTVVGGCIGAVLGVALHFIALLVIH